MTDRLKGFVVTLEHDIREDDAQVIVNAIRALRFVQDVSLVEAGFQDEIVRTRLRNELFEKVMEIFKENKKDIHNG